VDDETAGRAKRSERREAGPAVAGLVFAALLAVVGTLSTAASFSRGVAGTTRGLEHLEKDFAYRLPERRDEFGQIIQSINKMASVRRIGLAVSRELMRAQHGDVYYRPGVSGAMFVIRNPTEQQVETNYSRS
jgi:methyl-accepting chemotaxis protein